MINPFTKRASAGFPRYDGAVSRTHLSNRCDRCCMRRTLCLCGELPSLAVRTRLVVVMHYMEARTTTNTGRLAALAIPGSDVRVRGRPDQPLDPDGLIEPGSTPLILYPGPESEELTPELAAAIPGRINLVVPDGTWKQASKVAYREPALAGVRQVRLPPGPPSAYRLRKHPNPMALATLEAIARAIGILDGPAAQAALERLFDLMVARTLWGKGKMTTEECGDRLPEAAIRERQLSGYPKPPA